MMAIFSPKRRDFEEGVVSSEHGARGTYILVLLPKNRLCEENTDSDTSVKQS